MVKKVLITGGLGYVGGRIAQYLANTGKYDVTITTRQQSPHQVAGIRVLTIPAQVDDYSRYLEGIAVVIHLAAMNEIDCVKYPYEAIDVNITQSLKWLSAAEKAGIKQFIYFSTIHVYGSPLVGVIDETKITRPTHPYSITHRATEDYVLASRAQSGIDGIVLRLSNSFGMPVLPEVNRWTLLVNDLCRQAVETGNLTLHSDGSQERDFITMKDVVRAVEHFLQLDKTQTIDGLFNLSGETTFTVYEMAENIAKRSKLLLGNMPLINRSAPPNAGSKYTLFCSAEKLESTGFNFTREIENELDNSLLFCQKHFGLHND